MTDRGRTTHVPARGKTRKKPGSIFTNPLLTDPFCPSTCIWVLCVPSLSCVREMSYGSIAHTLLFLRSARPATEAPNVGPRKQPKNSRKRCRVGPAQSAGETAEKQPEKHSKHAKQLFFGCLAAPPAVFRLFSRHFTRAHPAPSSAVFWLFSRSDVRGLCSWSGRS